MEVRYDNVRVPESNLVLGWGKGFEIIQGRLGKLFVRSYECHRLSRDEQDPAVSTTACARSELLSALSIS